MTLEFKALTWVNRNTPLKISTDTLPVEKSADGSYQVDNKSILVKIRAAALNPVDIILKTLAIPGVFRAEKGFGLDYSGEVVALGSLAAQKTGLAVGDKVCGLHQRPFGKGSVAEFTLIDITQKFGKSIRKIPGNLSWEEAAAYPLVFGTAQSMYDNCLKGNKFKKVLILGAGTSVGRYSVQLAKYVYGSEHIVVTCSGKTEPIARELGATEVIDYTKSKSILNPVLELVKETGKFDAVLDCSGNSDLFSNMSSILRSKKEFGSYVTIVGDAKLEYTASGFMAIPKNALAAVRGLRSKIGLLPYHYLSLLVQADGVWPDELVLAFNKHKIKVFIDSTYPLADFQAAVDRLGSNKAVGKVVITIDT